VQHLALVHRHEAHDLAALDRDLGRQEAHLVDHLDAHGALRLARVGGAAESRLVGLGERRRERQRGGGQRRE
jgi:hypothetical protein